MAGFRFGVHLHEILGVGEAAQPRAPFDVAANLEIYDQEIEDAFSLLGAVVFGPQVAAGGPVGAIVAKIPLYDGPTLIGYVPVYDTIT